MITMTTHDITSFMKAKFEDLAPFMKNGVIDKTKNQSIGILLGSDSRGSGDLALGGIDCTSVRMLPINILIRWTDNQRECDNLAVRIYNAFLLQNANFMFEDLKFAYIQLLDSCPNSLGRDDKNICETVIRANFYYYIGGN